MKKRISIDDCCRKKTYLCNKKRIMTDWDSIWHKQDEVRTVTNAVLGECIWNLRFNEKRMAIEMELTQHLEEEEADALANQFTIPADYDGEGSHGTQFVFHLE